MLCILCLKNYILDNFKHDNKHHPVSNFSNEMMRWGKKVACVTCPVFMSSLHGQWSFMSLRVDERGHDVWSSGCDLQFFIIKPTTGDIKSLCATMAPLLLRQKQAERLRHKLFSVILSPFPHNDNNRNKCIYLIWSSAFGFSYLFVALWCVSTL